MICSLVQFHSENGTAVHIIYGIEREVAVHCVDVAYDSSFQKKLICVDVFISSIPE